MEPRCIVSVFFVKEDVTKRARGIKRPKGNWQDVLEEVARNENRMLDFGRLKNVRFGLGRR
ncbi:hypothetical protein RvY_17589 [Ramazzottius varieornatus]|uniref:Uncharacterized protein n=1 Tax=Ramazzottius varieornatus TaxID=947166 RepID=A0A1D1W2N5_RAMVA|nr:hypothetical protein RvY_17589 [Ramazzottius varieornatus]